MWLQGDRVVLTALDARRQLKSGDRDIGPFEEDHGFGKSPVVSMTWSTSPTTARLRAQIVALDRKSGEVRWHIPRESGTTAFATPCLFDPAAKEKQLLTVSTASGLTAIDAKTGKVAWQGLKDGLTQRCVSSPIVAGGMVFVSQRPRRQRKIANRRSPRG